VTSPGAAGTVFNASRTVFVGSLSASVQLVGEIFLLSRGRVCQRNFAAIVSLISLQGRATAKVRRRRVDHRITWKGVVRPKSFCDPFATTLETRPGDYAAATIFIAGAFLGSPARADTVDVYIDNVDNHAVTLTATDKNSGQSLVSGKALQHNERWSGKMLLDKDNNGHVYFEATGVNAPNCEKRTYDAKQLSRGSSLQVSLKCK